MSDHWWWRPGVRPGRRMYVWHILPGDQPAVAGLARHCQERVRAIPYLEPVPVEWLHMTTLVVGFADEIDDVRLRRMIETARERLRSLEPVGLRLGRVLGHTEALVLGVSPEYGLDALHSALWDSAATTVDAGIPSAGWEPHLSVAYCAADAPAAPVFAAMRPPPDPVPLRVGAAHLVSQERVGHAYVWEPVATVELGG